MEVRERKRELICGLSGLRKRVVCERDRRGRHLGVSGEERGRKGGTIWEVSGLKRVGCVCVREEGGILRINGEGNETKEDTRATK